MTLQATYRQFLAAPNPISLAEKASLHYIPTLTTLSQSGDIVRHLEAQNKKEVRTTSGHVIWAVEDAHILALEVATKLEFISGGGAYLPGLENFVVDKVAMIPMVREEVPPPARPTALATRLT
jgi:glutathione S-transferase